MKRSFPGVAGAAPLTAMNASMFTALVAAPLAALLAIVPVSTGFAQTTNQPAQPQAEQAPAAMPDPDTTVVAEVGEEKVFLSDILRMVQSLPAQYQQAPLPMIYPALLDRAINAKLIAKAGRNAGIGDRDDVKAQVRSAEDDIISRTYLTDLVSDRVTKETLEAAYANYVKENPAGEEVKARHILLESEADARSVIEELGKGADFATVAAERSTGPSAPSGGDLGWFGRGQMVPEFEEVAFVTEPGTFTKDPVQSQFGWHVILVEDRRQGTAPSFEEAREELTRNETQRVIGQLLEDLQKASPIKRYNFDGTALQPAQ